MEKKVLMSLRVPQSLHERLQEAASNGRYKKSITQIMINGAEKELDEIEKRERRK